jgi:hypothetical protein
VSELINLLQKTFQHTSDVLHQTEAFALRGWAWLIVFFLLYPIRHFITRLFEGWSLGLEHFCIRRNWLGFSSLKIQSVAYRSFGRSGNVSFSLQGVLVIINLMTTGNFIDSTVFEVDGHHIGVRWELNKGGPKTLGPRAAESYEFWTTDIPWPQGDKAVDIVLKVKDMFDRTYSFTAPYKPA